LNNFLPAERGGADVCHIVRSCIQCRLRCLHT
jgi:hypothetical protein